jgi:LPXTG-site transpeptidase (sortase) family protein
MSDSSNRISPALRWLIILGVVVAVSLVALFLQRQNQAATTLFSSTPSRPDFVPTPLPGSIDILLTIQAGSTPVPGPPRPAHLEIASANIAVSILIVTTDLDGYIVTPSRYAGYWTESATLDQPDNVIIVGHNRTDTFLVFAALAQVQPGDEIVIVDQFGAQYRYIVSETAVVKIEGGSEDEQAQALAYVQPTGSAQLTLVTCYPDAACGSRLFVIAAPAGE